MNFFGKHFGESHLNSEYDILGTVQPAHEDLIRIWISWIQKIPLLEIAQFSRFDWPLNMVVFQNVLLLLGDIRKL